MALIEIKQGGIGAPPNDASFWVTYDDATLRIDSMRCTNNNAAKSCRMIFKNATTGQNSPPFDVGPNSELAYTMKRNESYSIADDAWGYTMVWI